jgi:hypothetical protein
MITGVLYWPVVGMMVLVRVLSVGIWVALRVVVTVMPAVAWCMYQLPLHN